MVPEVCCRLPSTLCWNFDFGPILGLLFCSSPLFCTLPAPAADPPQPRGAPQVWEGVKEIEGAFIVNSGDMLHRWTNGRMEVALQGGDSMGAASGSPFLSSWDPTLIASSSPCRLVPPQ